MHFRSTVDDTIHWPRQNYERDCVSNVHGFKCGCGRNWRRNFRLHDIFDCSWNKCTSDVIYSNYDNSPNCGICPIVSYLDLAVKSTCRCLSFISLIKHDNIHCNKEDSFPQLFNPKAPIDLGTRQIVENFVQIAYIIVVYNMAVKFNDFEEFCCGMLFLCYKNKDERCISQEAVQLIESLNDVDRNYKSVSEFINERTNVFWSREKTFFFL